MSLSEGDPVNWNSPQGVTHGIIVEKRTKDFTFKAQKFTATPDEPSFIVESASTGAHAAHRGDALTPEEA